MLEKLRTRGAPLLIVAVAGAALWLLYHELHQYRLQDIWQSLREIPRRQLVYAAALTGLSYLILIAYDVIGLLYIGRALPASRVSITALLGFSVSNSFGTLLGGTSVRWRLYSIWGLSTIEILKLTLLLSVTFWVGTVTLASVLFVLAPLQFPAGTFLPIANTRPLGLLMGLSLLVYLGACWLQPRSLRYREWTLQFPSIRLAGLQMLVGVTDLTVAAGVLYALLPASLDVSFSTFVGVYLLSLIGAILSHVPGGAGVLELLILWLLQPEQPQAVLASLLAFRVIYYLLPLLAAFLALGAHELWLQRARVAVARQQFGRWSGVIVPRMLSLSIFAAGMVLLFSGATPGEEDRMHWLRTIVPLPAMEVSHFLGSIVGVLLLLLARSLQRRIESAYFATVGLLVAGIVFSLAKGFDYEEALLLGFLLLLFWPCREHFFRRGRLIPTQVSPRWLAALLLVLLSAGWLTLFAYKHVDYSNQLWWEFAFSADAPRSLRALAGAVITLLVVLSATTLSARTEVPRTPTREELQTVQPIIAACPHTAAHLALLGDKSLLFNDDRTAFVMYGRQGYSWIAMGDPVGDDAAGRELAWKFFEESDAAGCWPVFYQVDAERVPQYVEMGLTLIKLGEEARVPLATFNLEGSHRKGLRRTCKQFTESGVSFRVLPPPIDDQVLAELKAVSDAWLGEKSTAEKGFSLGFFQPEYLRECPIAVLVQDERIAAFANLWEGPPGTELSIDLMRHLSTAPSGSMEYLFIQLMLWGREHGFAWFNLGMAPLSGVEQHPLGPAWNRAAALAFQHGEHFYNFQGLRQYKEKFDPVWSPKYLASPGGWALPLILSNVAVLIAGGVTRLVKKS